MAIETVSSERRTEPRVRFAHNHTAVRKGGAELLVDLCELSQGGAVCRVDAGTLAIGDEVEIAHPRLPDGEELFWVPGSVVRLSDDLATAIVSFHPLEASMREDLLRLLEELIFERRPYEGHSAPVGYGDQRFGSRVKLRVKARVGEDQVVIEDASEYGLLLSTSKNYAVDQKISISAEGKDGRAYPIQACVVYQRETAPPADGAYQLGLRVVGADDASVENLANLIKDLLG